MKGFDPEAVRVFKELASIPSYSSASVLSFDGETNTFCIQVTSTIRDIQRQGKRKNQTIFSGTLSTNGSVSNITRSFPVELENVALQATSPTGTLIVVCRNVTEKDGKKRRFVEVYDRCSMKHEIEVTDSHGDFYNDELFSALSFSPDESILAYVAERKPINGDCVEKYVYEPDFGEGYTKKGLPVIVTVSLTDHKIKVLELQVPAGQPVFSDNDSLICLRVPTAPIRYGVRFCTNRIMMLMKVSLLHPANETEIIATPSGWNARYPRITPDRKNLVYISNVVGGAHNSTCRIMIHDITDGRIGEGRVLVDIESSNNGAPLYLDKLVDECFVVLVRVNLQTGECTRITAAALNSSWQLLTASKGLIVASASSTESPNKLRICRDTDVGVGPVWSIIAQPSLQKGQLDILDSIKSWTVTLRDNLEYIYVRPDNVSRGTLIYPHGGPHAAFTTEYSLYTACLAALGYSLALVNYTGSIGYGESSIQALLGNIGILDVEDVHAVTMSLREKDPHARFALFGGSHGGFLSAHLLGRHPDIYQCGVLRNPVMNVGAMYANSDIPDWTMAESGIPFSFATPPVLSATDYSHMFDKSPVAVADKVRAPVLLLLGEGDRRVPPSEGLRWAQYLKGQGKDVSVYMFPETGHSLDTVEAETFGFYASATFFLCHFA
ncbi:hypothetical protein SeMB42_g05645 [Synchytrium endobioticum]|uniref:Prolyl endopeptidase n=1 Tax=Synchytrium endobioticum TaxID=286115 RepID=A0A507CQB0_9FUNG|nr:hypothetical protein SeMB42_g05645 [Synchytrium endobioticum]